MNMQLVDAYDKWAKSQGIDDFAEFPPTKVRTGIPKMPVVVEEIDSRAGRE
jgi:hypothetical protein